MNDWTFLTHTMSNSLYKQIISLYTYVKQPKHTYQQNRHPIKKWIHFIWLSRCIYTHQLISCDRRSVQVIQDITDLLESNQRGMWLLSCTFELARWKPSETDENDAVVCWYNRGQWGYWLKVNGCYCTTQNQSTLH